MQHTKSLNFPFCANSLHINAHKWLLPHLTLLRPREYQYYLWNITFLVVLSKANRKWRNSSAYTFHVACSVLLSHIFPSLPPLFCLLNNCHQVLQITHGFSQIYQKKKCAKGIYFKILVWLSAWHFRWHYRPNSCPGFAELHILISHAAICEKEANVKHSLWYQTEGVMLANTSLKCLFSNENRGRKVLMGQSSTSVTLESVEVGVPELALFWGLFSEQNFRTGSFPKTFRMTMGSAPWHSSFPTQGKNSVKSF